MDKAKIFIYISKVLTKVPSSLMSTYNIEMDKVDNIMYVAVQVTASLSILSGPFLPFSSKKLKSLSTKAKSI